MYRTNVWLWAVVLIALCDGERVSAQQTDPSQGASAEQRLIVWDGEGVSGGKGWLHGSSPVDSFAPQRNQAHSGAVALELHGEGSGFIGGGWNWHGWYPPDAGVDISGYQNLSFWMKVVGPKLPGSIGVALVSSGVAPTAKGTRSADVTAYEDHLMDGRWHEVKIPLKDMVDPDHPADFDPSHAWQLNISTWQADAAHFSVYLDDIGFDKAKVHAHGEWVTLPEPRDPAQPTNVVNSVHATVDITAPGTTISPYIYGAAMGDPKGAREMGISIRRAGGNPVSPYNWQRGCSAKGADWYFQNDGANGPPEKGWMAAFHGENRAAGLETYLTLPCMGRVAKDNSSVGFDTTKYPEQTSWAGKVQPGDPHPNAGNGIQLARGSDGQISKDAKGNPITRDVAANPDDASVAVTPEQQTDFLRFLIDKMKYGTADKGGIRYIALDNEPALWSSTHRAMHPEALSYDQLWNMTVAYAMLLKKIDPSVQIAGPAAWGWTEYFYSGLDSQLCGQGKASWEHPPDYAAHGSVPLVKWWLARLHDHQKQTGRNLIDILDFHFYPQTGIGASAATEDPKVMESRVEETRVLWDPTWKDPSWMGRETGHVIRLLPMVHEWIDTCNPGMKTALGEYNFGGESNVSGGIAEAELLGIFAREKLDFAFYWFFPPINSPPYFAFKLYRNPDGKHTMFGNQYLPGTCDKPTDVSIHAARAEDGRVTFVLINKRAVNSARVAITLNQAVPAQQATLYEYSGRDKHAIGKLPDQAVGGRMITIDLPPMSAMRFDVKTK